MAGELQADGAEIDASTSSIDGASIETRQLAAAVRGRLFAGIDATTRVGRYTLIERIGEGGMGVVYRALDEQLGRVVALKLQRPRGDDTPAEYRRLLQEARALATLAHPNVVSVFEVGEEQGRIFLVMEFIAGMTLRDWRAERARSWREVLGVLVQAGRGLAAAHAHGIVHRDVKPDNVMIGGDGRARLVDFGLARVARAAAAITETPEVATFGLAGTPAYMAPEQFLGEEADASSDQFSFCKVAWEALHGQSPHAGADLLEVRDAVLADRVLAPRRGRVPRSVRLALRRGLHSDRAARHPAMTPLLDTLERARARWRGWVVVGALLALALPATLVALYLSPYASVPEDMSLSAPNPMRRRELAPRPWLTVAARRGECLASRARVGPDARRVFHHTRTVSSPVSDMQASFYNPKADEVVVLSYRGEGVRMTRDGAVLGSVTAPTQVAPMLDGAAYDPRRGVALLVSQACVATEVDPVDFSMLSLGRLDAMFCGGVALAASGEVHVAETVARRLDVLSATDWTRLRQVPIAMAGFDGIASISATGEWLMIDWHGLAAIVGPEGAMVVPPGVIGAAAPLLGGEVMAVPDAAHVVCKTGEVWVCEGLDGSHRCNIYAPAGPRQDTCACL